MGHYAVELSCPECKNIHCTCPIDPSITEMCDKHNKKMNEFVQYMLKQIKTRR